MSVPTTCHDQYGPIIKIPGTHAYKMTLIWDWQDRPSTEETFEYYDVMVSQTAYHNRGHIATAPNSQVQTCSILWELAECYGTIVFGLPPQESITKDDSSEWTKVVDSKFLPEDASSGTALITWYAKAANCILEASQQLFRWGLGATCSKWPPRSSKRDNSVQKALAQTPIAWAAQNSQIAGVELLIKNYGVDANVKDTQGRTPLYWAVQAKKEAQALDMIRKLLQIDTNLVLETNAFNETPLFWAIKSGYTKVARAL